MSRFTNKILVIAQFNKILDNLTVKFVWPTLLRTEKSAKCCGIHIFANNYIFRHINQIILFIKQMHSNEIFEYVYIKNVLKLSQYVLLEPREKQLVDEKILFIICVVLNNVN